MTIEYIISGVVGAFICAFICGGWLLLGDWLCELSERIAERKLNKKSKKRKTK